MTDDLDPEGSRQTREALLDTAETALENNDPATAYAACEALLNADPKDGNALYLMAEALRDLGDGLRALDMYRRCVMVEPKFSPAWSGLGVLHLNGLEYDEAARALNRAIREDVTNAEAWYGRAILRELRDDFAGADRDLVRAARLDPVGFPLPVVLDDETVDTIVSEALSRLHPDLQEYLGNVALLLDEVPSRDVLSQYDPPAPPTHLLGYFNGYSLMERSLEDPWSRLPSAIVLFRRNLQRLASDRDQLIEELRITFYHEVGHFLGLSEADLAARGLD